MKGATIGMVSHDPRYAEYAERQIQLFDGQILGRAQDLPLANRGRLPILDPLHIKR
jgi:ABC-type lipoprotein export system ATPase subunit